MTILFIMIFIAGMCFIYEYFKEERIKNELFYPKQYKDGWYYTVVMKKEKFIGLAKQTPFTKENPDPIKEPGEIWFEFGNTPSDALHSIVISLKEK